MPIGAQNWSDPVKKSFYRYDVFAEAQKALQYEEKDSLPKDWMWFGDIRKGAKSAGIRCV